MLTILLQHRARFQPNVFHRESPDEESAKKDPEHASRVNTSNLEPCPEDVEVQQSRPKMTTWKMTVRRLSEMERYRTAGRRKDVSSRSRAFALERSTLRKTEVGLLQSVEEVWFAGCHSDVGGQYSTFYHVLSPLIPIVSSKGGTVADDCRYSLADIPLRWMVKQVVLSQCGILFDHNALRKADIDISSIVFVDPDQPTVGDFWKKEPQASESSAEASGHESGDHSDGNGVAEPWPTDQDVLTDCHDELKSRKAWWMLELFPMKYAWQEANGKWNAKWG